MESDELEPGGHHFDQMEADAVCSQCHTVNDEGTLLCKACGNNLREQRAQRIAQAAGGEYITPRKNPAQLLTGLLVVFGILAIFYVVFNLQKFENMMLDSISSQVDPADQDLWEGTYANLYEEMLTDIEQNPTSTSVRRISLKSPLSETIYTGRYLIIPSGRSNTSDNVVGEAQLERQGDRVHFVYLSDEKFRIVNEARGFTDLEIDEESGELSNPRVLDTAELYTNGEYFFANGASAPRPAGGHKLFVTHSGTNTQLEFKAFRVNN